jgi:hypothetical protein
MVLKSAVTMLGATVTQRSIKIRTEVLDRFNAPAQPKSSETDFPAQESRPAVRWRTSPRLGWYRAGSAAIQRTQRRRRRPLARCLLQIPLGGIHSMQRS